jgi:rhombotail lipoprotein
MKLIRFVTFCVVLGMTALMAGCSFMTRTHRSSSVVQYLYPKEKGFVESTAVPRLELPLRVGIAFVPEDTKYDYPLAEQAKMDLMKTVGDHFKQYDFVKSIELIPSAYLVKGGSFANLDQIRTMYGVNVIILLSYDQTQFTGEGFASLTYWTLIGAYVVKGEKNDTQTMLDAAIYDIPSRKMLFRAPGTSLIKSKATPVNLSEQLRKDSEKGFQLASLELIKNLDIQLGLFKQRVKERPDEYQVVKLPDKTGGGGSLDLLTVGLLLALGGIGLWRERRTAAL